MITQNKVKAKQKVIIQIFVNLLGKEEEEMTAQQHSLFKVMIGSCAPYRSDTFEVSPLPPPSLPPSAAFLFNQGTMVNELGEARYLRKLRGQSELWNVVEAILLGLICAAFTARILALVNDSLRVGWLAGRQRVDCSVG